MSPNEQEANSENTKASNKEALMALQILLEDFEDRIRYQDEVQEEGMSEAEESSPELAVHSANIRRER